VCGYDEQHVEPLTSAEEAGTIPAPVSSPDPDASAAAGASDIEAATRTSSGQFYKNYQNPSCPIMAYGAYRSLWNHINGDDAWEANPWVVAYTFRVQMQNIDQIARAA